MSDDLKASPRSAIIGALADLAQKGRDVASRIGGPADWLYPSQDAVNRLNDLSYGTSPFNLSQANIPLFKPGAEEILPAQALAKGGAAAKASILVPVSWLKKGMAFEQPIEKLGRVVSPSGQEFAALPRTLSPFNTPLSAPLPHGPSVPLGEISPEIKGTPLESIRVGLDSTIPPNARGVFDKQQNFIGFNPQHFDPQNPMAALSTIHHEATHGAQFASQSLGRGASPQSFSLPNWKNGLEEGIGYAMRRLNPDTSADARFALDLGFASPNRGYLNNEGEIMARIAGDTAPYLSPSSNALQLALQKNNPQNATVFIQGQNRSPLLLPSDSFRKGWLSILNAKDNPVFDNISKNVIGTVPSLAY